MCTVSNIGDAWPLTLPQRYPKSWPNLPDQIDPAEFEKLKKEVQALKDLLKQAKIFDAETGQPDCHMDEKVQFIRKMADMLGVDFKDVF